MSRAGTDRVLGILAKRPRPGEVKTRLARETDPDFAARLAEACLGDVLDRCGRVDARRLLLFAPHEDEPWFRAAAPDWQRTPQASGDLGDRLAAYFAAQAETLDARVVALGTDSPNLPLDWLNDAFTLLAAVDVVVGPTLDGGYYLIGCRRHHECLWNGIDWGSPRVLAQTLDKVERGRLRLGLLPPWYDVDTLADCRFLKDHLAAQRRAGQDPQAPRTEALCALF